MARRHTCQITGCLAERNKNFLLSRHVRKKKTSLHARGQTICRRSCFCKLYLIWSPIILNARSILTTFEQSNEQLNCLIWRCSLHDDCISWSSQEEEHCPNSSVYPRHVDVFISWWWLEEAVPKLQHNHLTWSKQPTTNRLNHRKQTKQENKTQAVEPKNPPAAA